MGLRYVFNVSSFMFALAITEELQSLVLLVHISVMSQLVARDIVNKNIKNTHHRNVCHNKRIKHLMFVISHSVLVYISLKKWRFREKLR